MKSSQTTDGFRQKFMNFPGLRRLHAFLSAKLREPDPLLIVSVLVIAGYSLLTFNRFSPITEGWFSEYGDLIRRGKVPYRDFYLFLPPGYPLLIAGVIAVFGPAIIVLRIAGVLLMAIFSGLLYLTLESIFTRWVAAAATCFSLIYYQTGVAHISYDFVQVMNVLLVGGAYCVSRESAEIGRLGRGLRGIRWPLAAGVCCGLACFIKQSNASIATAFLILAFGLAGARTSVRRALSCAAGVIIGALIVSVIFAGYLAAASAIRPFLDQVVSGSIEAKGRLPVILFSFVGHFFGQTLWEQTVIMARYAWLPLACGISAIWFPSVFSDRGPSSGNARTAMLFGLLFILIVSGAWFLPDWIRETLDFRNSVGNFLIPISVLGTLAILGAASFGFPRKIVGFRSIGPMAVVSLGLIWGNGTSAGLSETGVFFGLALAIGILLSHASVFRPVAFATLCGLSILAGGWTEQKLERPYAWWGIAERDVRSDLVPLASSVHRGLRASKGTASTYNAVIRAITEYSAPNDRILVFPHTPIFYLATNRVPMAKAVVEWFDFLPDRFASEEASILLNHPPRMVVWLNMPEEVWTQHERLFRNGRPCGQRLLKAALDTLVRSGTLRECSIVPVSPGFEYHIYCSAADIGKKAGAATIGPSAVAGLSAQKPN